MADVATSIGSETGARMYEQMLSASTDVRVMVFRDVDEARAWPRRIPDKEEHQ